LAALDQQANAAMARLALTMGEPTLAQQAAEKAKAIGAKIDAQFYDADFYAFSRGSDGALDHTATVYPAVAWWDGTYDLAKAGPMLGRWASSEFSTDWGARDISETTPFYDPISYHQGSVWPLFTGWVSLAEYRAGRPLAGYASLMQNLNLTWVQDLGSVTELLSGEFFQPLGRSSSHQLWSSAMVVSPLVRGLFGLDWDAVTKRLRVNPQLPADWDRVKLRNVRVGDASVDVEMERTGGALQITALTKGAEILCLTSGALANKPCEATPAKSRTINVPLPAIELAIPAQLPEPGERTRQLKGLNEERGERSAEFSFEAQAGSVYDLPLRMNRPGIATEGAQVRGGKLHLEFPAGQGYVKKTITFKW
jgi:hypothetical protein